jgi:RecG-like helicase
VTAAAPARPLTALPGIGPARAERLARLGLHTVRDLLLLVPRRLAELPARSAVNAARGAVGRHVCVGGHLAGVPWGLRGRKSLVRIFGHPCVHRNPDWPDTWYPQLIHLA